MNTIRRTFIKVLKNDSGLTLTELLIYLVITAFLSLGISRLITDSAAGLDRASQESIAARQVIRFYNTLKFDISGATDVKILPSASPSANLYCNESDTKPLFTVQIKKLKPPSYDGTKDSYDFEPVNYLATYGLNEQKIGAKSKWYFRRVLCTETSKDLQSPDFENLIYLGNAVNPDLISGNQVLSCEDLVAQLKCRTYSIKLPYSDDSKSGPFSTIKLSNELKSFQRLTRQIDDENES